MSETKEKPFLRTVNEHVARLQPLAQNENEISAFLFLVGCVTNGQLTLSFAAHTQPVWLYTLLGINIHKLAKI
jgi:hypothetical protein